MEKVIVTINPKTGEVTYEIDGIRGTRCDEITQILTARYQVKSKEYTHEYTMPDDLPQHIKH